MSSQKQELEKQMIMLEISQAFIKDLKADKTKYETVLLDPYDNIYAMESEYSSSIYSEEYYDDNWLSVYDGSMLNYVRNNIDEDIVCQINISANSKTGIFSSNNSLDETYYIPSSYTNTLETLRKYGIIDADNNLNQFSDFASYFY